MGIPEPGSVFQPVTEHPIEADMGAPDEPGRERPGQIGEEPKQGQGDRKHVSMREVIEGRPDPGAERIGQHGEIGRQKPAAEASPREAGMAIETGRGNQCRQSLGS